MKSENWGRPAHHALHLFQWDSSHAREQVYSVRLRSKHFYTQQFVEFFRQGTNGLTVQGHSSVRGNWDLNPGSVAKAEAQGEAVNSPGSHSHSPRAGSCWLPSSPGKAMTPDS